jgi:hypothetical protein
MVKSESQADIDVDIDVEQVTVQWLRIANGVARGRLTPEEGAARLEALAEAHPEDREWLEDEVEMIRRYFALDVAESIRGGEGSYWDKLRQVIDALLDERLDHDRALELLTLIDNQHPEQTEETFRLISGIQESPLRRLLDRDD